MGPANNSNSFDFNHSNQYQPQHPLTDMSGNYSNIVITSSPLKNSNFYFNDEVDTMSAQNENININLTPSKTILQDPALQFLYQGVPQQQPMRQIQSTYMNQNQAPQDSNETDDEKTDDESGNGQTEETQPPQHSYQSYQHQPQMLQFPPTIQNSAQLQQQQQQQQHPIYYMPQGQALSVPQFVHPQNVNMAMNMNMGVGVAMNMGMGMNMGMNGMLNMNMANAYAQQQQFVPSTQQQTNLYPPVEHLPASSTNTATARSSSSTSSSAGRLPESNSNNTISSFDSIPAFMISSSISDPSISSPSSSFNNTTLMTPQRQSMNTNTNTNTNGGGGSATGRRTSVTMTPTSFKTPSRSQSFVVPVLAQGSQVSPKLVRTAQIRRNTTSSVTTTATTSATGPATKAHRRSRSRLSADPSGAASIVTSLSEHRLPTFLQRSPTAAAAASGTNPFYPHSSSSSSNLISPHHPGSRLTTSQSLNNLNSPISTPLATPGSLKRSHYLDGDEADDDAKERLRKISSISSISPNMLMNRSFLESVQDVSETNTEEDVVDDDDTQSDGSIKFQEQFNGASEITFPISNFTNLAMMGDNTSFLYDPSNVEVTNDHSPLKSSPEKPLQQKKQQQQKPKKIARSQATIDLKPFTAEQTEANNGGSDINNNGNTQPQSGEDLIKVRNLEDHPLIDRSLKYDKPIIFGRKRVVKSASTNSLNEDQQQQEGLKTTKSGKPKKSHPCPLCGVILQRPEHVKRHMNSHSSEKPFVCEEPDCGVRFNRKDNLRAHIRNIHHMNV